MSDNTQDRIKPSVQCKQAGLKSFNELIERTGESKQTLNNWSKNKPKLFNIVVLGAVAEKEAEANET